MNRKKTMQANYPHTSRYVRILLCLLGIGWLIAGAAAAIAHADGLMINCGGGAGVTAGTPTSCAFAHSVRGAILGQQGNPVYAYSPVTGQTYEMYCRRGYVTFSDYFSTFAFICDGGDNAEVVAW